MSDPRDILASFFLFVVLILVLGFTMPQYFAGIAKFITDNLTPLTILVILAVILRILTGRRG